MARFVDAATIIEVKDVKLSQAFLLPTTKINDIAKIAAFALLTATFFCFLRDTRACTHKRSSNVRFRGEERTSQSKGVMSAGRRPLLNCVAYRHYENLALIF